MITFKEVLDTQKEFKDTAELIDKIRTTQSTYKYIGELNRETMKTMNRILGKYFTEDKKAIIHEYPKDEYHNYTLQLSKKGIGKTSGYRSQIEVFNYLIGHQEKKNRRTEFINEVILKDEIFEKTKEHLSVNGKAILDIFKETYKEYPITSPNDSRVYIEIKPTKDEVELFHQPKIYIEIQDDESDINVYISYKKADDKGSYPSRYPIFEVNKLTALADNDFIKTLFIYNHKDEIELAIQKYKDDTTPQRELWKNFNDKLNEGLAKYLLLDKI